MKRLFLLFLGAAICFPASAQQLKTAYISDNYIYSYRLNPAFHPEYGFIGLPVIGSTSLTYNGDFAIGDLVRMKKGELVTFANESISADEFLGNFRKGMNRISSDLSTNLFSIGFNTKGGMYSIIDVNMRNYVDGKLPYDFLRFLKTGNTKDGTYNLDGLRVHASSFIEIGLSSSWKVRRKVTFGMRFKALLGLTDAFIDLNRMTITRSQDSWTVRASGSIGAAYDGFRIATDNLASSEEIEILDLKNTRIGAAKEGINGYGVGADLGFLYDDSSWQISGSVSDIGCLFWFHNLYGHTPGITWYSNVDQEPHTQGGSTAKNEFSDLGELLNDVFKFKSEYEYQKLWLMPFTARFGVKYLYYSDLSFGGLATYRYDEICPFWELRGSVETMPFRWFDLIGSIGVNNYGVNAGLFANIRILYLNAFIGTDNILGAYSRGWIPSGRHIPNVMAGLNIVW